MKVYEIVNKLPEVEKYALAQQLRRAAVSMPSNIAEGCSRTSNKEIARFIEYAIGSAFEVETQVLAAVRLQYLEEAELKLFFEEMGVLQRKMNNYRTYLLRKG